MVTSLFTVASDNPAPLSVAIDPRGELRLDFNSDANMLRIFPQMTRRVSVTQPGPQGPDAVTTRRVSVTQPGSQGPEAVTTWRVSVTPPTTPLGGWAPLTT